MEGDRGAFKMLTGKPLGKPRRKSEENTRMDLEEIGINTRNWVDSAPDRNYCECCIEPLRSTSHGVSYLVS